MQRSIPNTNVSAELQTAISHPVWRAHSIGDLYVMDNKPDHWMIAYYPIFSDGKTGNRYSEPRALIEKPAIFNGQKGTDFREVPLRYLSKILLCKKD